jgi:hypothetical protein
MKYSFIAPRSKRIISGEMRLALFFFTVNIAMLSAAYFFLTYKTVEFKEKHSSFTANLKQLDDSIHAVKEKMGTIEAQIKKNEQISTDNTVMAESIRNIFDLTPDNITLTSAQLDEKSLILYGITPNKDTYNFMLEAPLRSIFHRTYTSFYPIENGWYRFVSTNYLDDESALEVTE